jgi:hypothetical protein
METVIGLFVAFLGTFILLQCERSARNVFAKNTLAIPIHDSSLSTRILRKQITRDAGSIF